MHYDGPPATSVSITVHSARELKSGDLFGKSDPFVKLELGGKEQKTAVKKGQSPVWEQTFTFNYASESSVRLYVYDKDLLRNDFLGVHDFPLLPVLQIPERHFHGEVAVTSKKGKSAGHLRITVQFYPKADGSVPGAGGERPIQQPPLHPQGQMQPPNYGPPPGYGGAYNPAGAQQVVNAQFPGYGVPAQGWPQQQGPPGGYPQGGYPHQPYPQGPAPPYGHGPPPGYGVPPPGYGGPPPHGHSPQRPPYGGGGYGGPQYGQGGGGGGYH